MKIRLHYLGALLLCFVFLCGCVDFYAGQRPMDNTNERWVSEDPEMYFQWVENIGHRGEITIDGNITKVDVLFDYGNGVHVDCSNDSLAPNDRLFRGECKFGKEKLIITVISDDANLFNGDFPTITFIRQELQEDGTFAVPE